MASERRSDAHYYKNLSFDFLNCERMELYQPSPTWNLFSYVKDGVTKRRRLTARDLDLNHHFTKDTLPQNVTDGLKKFLGSLKPLVGVRETEVRASIQSQILTVSGDIIGCSDLLRKSSGKYKQEHRFLLSTIAIKLGSLGRA